MNDEISKHMSSIGSKGGKATKDRHGTEHFKKLGRKGQEAMRKSLNKNEN